MGILPVSKCGTCLHLPFIGWLQTTSQRKQGVYNNFEPIKLAGTFNRHFFPSALPLLHASYRQKPTIELCGTADFRRSLPCHLLADADNRALRHSRFQARLALPSTGGNWQYSFAAQHISGASDPGCHLLADADIWALRARHIMLQAFATLSSIF